ncbi:MAG TPA: enoyl-CoA hydratase-related protein [Stellaceae bacterium]|nr:enoyl-CoA hydratase-related protein [Stellaceae bacterium]
MASATATVTPSPAATAPAAPAVALTLANVVYEKKGAIAYVTINRPKVLNALNTPTWLDLRTAFEDARCRVTVGKPVIAAVNGFALGGGGTQRLPRLVGKGRALQLLLSGEMISAQEAYRIGLVNEIVPAADLITRAEAILNEIASNAPIAVKFALEAANKGLETSQGEGLLLEASYFGLCAATEDKKEGTSAFLEKRAPRFRGR